MGVCNTRISHSKSVRTCARPAAERCPTSGGVAIALDDAASPAGVPGLDSRRQSLTFDLPGGRESGGGCPSASSMPLSYSIPAAPVARHVTMQKVSRDPTGAFRRFDAPRKTAHAPLLMEPDEPSQPCARSVRAIRGARRRTPNG